MAQEKLLVEKPSKQDVFLKLSIASNTRAAAEFFNTIYYAARCWDEKSAREFLKQPGLIVASYAEITPYTLHTIVLMLINCDWEQVLQNMTDSQVRSLHTTLRSVILPTPTSASNFDKKWHDLATLLNYPENTNINYAQIATDIETLNGEDALRAKILFIEMEVMSNWDEISKETKKMFQTLNTFIQKQKAKSADVEKIDLVDIKALTAYLNGLKKILNERKEKIQTCDELIAKATIEKDFTKRKTFLEQAAYVNSELEVSQAETASIESTLKRGEKLLQERNAAMKKLQSLNTEITEFMAKTNHNVK